MVDLLLLSQFVRVDEVLRCYSTFVKRLMRHFQNLFIFLSSKENNIFKRNKRVQEDNQNCVLALEVPEN